MKLPSKRVRTVAIAIVVWLTPALVAGALGWSSVWGSGSALFDYLFPLPITGGILHVPSFLVFLGLFIALQRDSSWFRWLAPVAAAIATCAIALQLDFVRLNDWLFTDYDPTGSPLHFGRNPQLLFITTDALWLCVVALRQKARPLWLWVGPLLVPFVVIAGFAMTYTMAGPIFEKSVSRLGTVRGDEMHLVYTDQAFDSSLFGEWLQNGGGDPPWTTPNAEHSAFYFLNSRQQVAMGNFDAINSEATVGTLCWFEEDRSMTAHPGFHNCFADRETVAERLNIALAAQPVGWDDELRQWHAAASLCMGVSFDVEPSDAIENVDFCRRLRRNYKQEMLGIKRRLGRDSAAVRRMQRVAKTLGYDKR